MAAAIGMGAWMSLAASSAGSVVSKGPSLISFFRDNISSKKACSGHW